MNKIKKIRFALSCLCLGLIAGFLFFKGITANPPHSLNTNKSTDNIQNTSPINSNSFSDEAPEIKNNGKWINTDKEITLENLKGKVVLIEFWTFGCYNCQNTLPYLNKWYNKYKSDNFEMIGIHCPEFDRERNFENVVENVKELGIKYPVLTDNDFSVWNKYEVDAWPTIFLIDKKGLIRYKKVGEGKYEKTEQTINELLKEDISGEKNN